MAFRKKEIEGDLNLTAESYRRIRSYTKPKPASQFDKTKSIEAPKPMSLAAHIRLAESAINKKRRDKLEVIYADAPRYIRTGSKGDDLEATRKLLKLQKFDHKKYNAFMNTKFGSYLFEGIDDPEIDTLGITRTSQFIKEKNTYTKAILRAKHELLTMPKQAVAFDKSELNHALMINHYSPEYL